MWQKDALEAAGMSYDDAAQALRPVFPKMTKALISFGMRPKETGLIFSRVANRVIELATGYIRPVRRDRRRCPARIQARLTEAESAALNNAREVMGHSTTNDALRYALRLYIAEAKKRAAGTAGTVADGKQNYSTPII